MAMKKKAIRVIALSLATMTLALNVVQVSFAAGSDYYRNTLGTQKSLGSPLSNSDFSSDDWDKWEMAVFGIFLGNYVELGKEDYSTAFGATGKGLKALKFAAGGDVNSNGTLRKMLNLCMTSQKNTGTEIMVRYRDGSNFKNRSRYTKSKV